MLLLHGAFKLKQRAFVTLMHSALTTTRTQGMQTIFKCKTFVLFWVKATLDVQQKKSGTPESLEHQNGICCYCHYTLGSKTNNCHQCRKKTRITLHNWMLHGANLALQFSISPLAAFASVLLHSTNQHVSQHGPRTMCRTRKKPTTSLCASNLSLRPPASLIACILVSEGCSRSSEKRWDLWCSFTTGLSW